jgi:hypothetical protein
METSKFQKQLYVNLNVNKEILYDAIAKNKSAEDIALTYQYLTGNFDPIPQRVKNTKGVLYDFKSFDPFTLTVSYEYPSKDTAYFRTEEDAAKYAGTRYDEGAYEVGSLYKDKEYPHEATVIRMYNGEMRYQGWMFLSKEY